MGQGDRKRKPLRSNVSLEDNDRNKKNVKLGKASSVKSGGVDKNSCADKSSDKAQKLVQKVVQKSTVNTDEDDWEAIEQQQGIKSDDDDSDEDDDENDDEDEIRIEGAIQHVTEKYTFEFNDMREEYTEGICVLLRSLVQNPTKAYELAQSISAQSEESLCSFFLSLTLSFSVTLCLSFSLFLSLYLYLCIHI
jgi:hypothetical protein